MAKRSAAISHSEGRVVSVRSGPTLRFSIRKGDVPGVSFWEFEVVIQLVGEMHGRHVADPQQFLQVVLLDQPVRLVQGSHVQGDRRGSISVLGEQHQLSRPRPFGLPAHGHAEGPGDLIGLPAPPGACHVGRGLAGVQGEVYGLGAHPAPDPQEERVVHEGEIGKPPRGAGGYHLLHQLSERDDFRGRAPLDIRR